MGSMLEDGGPTVPMGEDQGCMSCGRKDGIAAGTIEEGYECLECWKQNRDPNWRDDPGHPVEMADSGPWDGMTDVGGPG